MTINHWLEIENLGQSISMHNLSRNIIESGELKNMIAQKGIRGITSNPAIFEKAIAGPMDSNIDKDIDAKLKNITARTVKAKLKAVKGKVAIANAKIPYQEYKKIIKSDCSKALSGKGAKVPRLLWAKTSTKNRTYSD